MQFINDITTAYWIINQSKADIGYLNVDWFRPLRISAKHNRDSNIPPRLTTTFKQCYLYRLWTNNVHTLLKVLNMSTSGMKPLAACVADNVNSLNGQYYCIQRNILSTCRAYNVNFIAWQILIQHHIYAQTCLPANRTNKVSSMRDFNFQNIHLLG